MGEDEYVQWDKENTVVHTAQSVFGVPYLYPWQRLVIADIIDAATEPSTEKCAGRVVLLPTGAGKSMCFMVPAMLLPHATLVVYPLLALMSDQVRRLAEAGVECAVLRGGQSKTERDGMFDKIKAGAHIILTNPEMLCQEDVILRLAECNVSSVVLDEAHCVVEWGESFRPAYLRLASSIRALHPDVVTAFTATASYEVLRRIQEILFGDEWSNVAVIRSDADRSNIHYFVVRSCSKVQTALKLSRSEEKPMLIFCKTRPSAENMARELCTLYGGDVARFYHAGMTREERGETEAWFFASDSGILAATCAYGMGVDKKNIRTVIHLDAPDTAEAYLQESGRGGRDGENMNAILLWSPADEARFRSYPVDSRRHIMLSYATTQDCRRQVLLDAIGGENAACNGCDNCGAMLAGGTPAWDGGAVLRFIASNRCYYTMHDAQWRLAELLNRSTQHGLHTWSREGEAEVLDNLMNAALIKERGGLWGRRITVTGEWKKLLDITQKR